MSDETCDLPISKSAVQRRVCRYASVTHSERGLETLKHFLLTLCGCKANWSMADVLDEQLQIIKDKVRGCGRVRGVRSR